MPEPVHRYTCRVLYGDTDAAGVVYYGNYLRYFERGRTELLRSCNTTYKEMEDQGFILPVIECYARYKASAAYDDLLVIETSLLDVKPISCRFNHRILREKDGKLIMKGHTIHAVINREGKLTKLPRNFVAKLLEISQTG